MSNPTNIKPRFFALALIGCLAACSNGVVDLGGGTIAQNVESGSRCSESTIVEEDVRVTNQDELDALLGCEEIRGTLQLDIFEGTDLAPLGDLRGVDGNLIIGGYPDVPEDLSEEALEEWQREYERVTAIAEAGWLSSLQGLESLERVGGLMLNRVSAPNLEAFESLRLIGGNVANELANQLAISAAPNLLDLSGLEGVGGFRVLTLSDNPSLQSLDGLTVPLSLDDLTLQNNLVLTNIDALAPLANVFFDIFIYNTAIADVDAFSNLKTATLGLALSGNPELTNVDALDGLEVADYLVFEDNPKLERLPEFVNLGALDGFKAMRNAKLESVSLNFPNWMSINVVDGTDISLSASVIEIGDNPELDSISFEAGFKAAEVLSIYRNGSLASVNLGSLERLDRLHLHGNTALTDVALGALQTVDSLSVIGNPLLSTTELRAVRTFESEFIDNADDPPPAP